MALFKPIEKILKQFLVRQFIISITCLALISCSTRETKNSLTKMKLTGPVQKVIEKYYGAREKFGEPEKTYFELMLEYEFDKNGNLIKLGRYDRFEKLEYREINKFDSRQRQIELSHYNSNGDLEYKNVFLHTDNGDTIETKTYDSFGKLTDRRAEVYSDESLRTEMIIYAEDKIQSKFKYEYDSAGELSRIKIYDNNGSLLEDKPPIKLAPGFGFDKFTDNDKHGNWLKAANSYRMCEREITYY